MQHLKQLRHKRREAAWAETQAVLIALGNITLFWSGINLILNTFIEAHRAHYGPIVRKDLPRSFTGKLDYLEGVEISMPLESEKLAQLRALRLELVGLNEERINVVHGTLRRRGYGPNWTIHVRKEVKDKLHRDALPRHSSDIHDLALRISDAMRRLARFFRPMFDK